MYLDIRKYDSRGGWLRMAQQEPPGAGTDRGELRVDVVSPRNLPVEGATVEITYTGDPESPSEQLVTDSSGHTPVITLPAPALEYSMEPSEYRPYAEYTIRVNAPGYEPADISGSEVLPDTFSIQPVQLRPLEPEETFEDIVIPDHTLYGDYPPKEPEAEVKPVNESGEIVLSRVVIPEYVVVHDGPPGDGAAENYYVRFRDYIKNVASSEIYATWPGDTIRANVLAILSFTLNRVYTEWYRNKGYDFTITSSTAYDQKWIPGRNIFERISEIVEELFADYLSKPDVRQPILTQYCDGKRVSCPGWLSQWGSKSLGDQGYSAIEILRYYYGDDLYINSAEEISGIPASWPRVDLTVGSSGPKVLQMQEQLNTIRGAYPALFPVAEDGIYGKETERAVRKFQEVFDLPVTGVVDYRTWYKIQEIFVGVTRIAELV